MSKTERRLTYLPDIDGLRAMAVLAVVLFHLKISGFDGGYVGVDIFFVISGFLISGLIRDRVETGTFSFSDFYARRVSRLLPAVLATVGATAIASILILQPDALGSFALSAAASVFSAANFIFYFESGYWDASAELKPLLHLWSLGVEEQFYLFWPAFIVLMTNTSRRFYKLGLVTLCLLSFVGCVYYTPIDSAASFYLLPFRVWQFALGALALEFWRSYRLTEFSRQLLRSLGLALCAISVITFSESTVFPGWLAVVPSAGAALVLISGHETSGSVWLSNPIAQWLGRLSYALYLVHWPPIALYRHYSVAELTPEVKVGLALLTGILAIILHYGVERQFYRRGHHSRTPWHGIPAYTIGGSILLGAALYGIHQNPDQFAYQQTVLSAKTVRDYKSRRFSLTKGVCRIDAVGTSKRCPLPGTEAVLFLGNSHEDDGYNIISAALGTDNHRPFIRFGSVNGCRDFEVDDDWASSSNPACQVRLAALRRSLENITWHSIIYSARRPYAENKRPLITILETIRSKQPQTHIVLIEDYLSTHRECASLINEYGSSRACGELSNLVGLPGVIKEYRPLEVRADAVSNSKLSKLDLLCNEQIPASCPTETPSGHPMSMDEHHLTLEFAQWIGGKLAEKQPLWLRELRYTEDDKEPRRD